MDRQKTFLQQVREVYGRMAKAYPAQKKAIYQTQFRLVQDLFDRGEIDELQYHAYRDILRFSQQLTFQQKVAFHSGIARQTVGKIAGEDSDRLSDDALPPWRTTDVILQAAGVSDLERWKLNLLYLYQKALRDGILDTDPTTTTQEVISSSTLPSTELLGPLPVHIKKAIKRNS